MAPAAACVGIGWRHPHYAQVLHERPALDFLEVHSENFFGAGGAALAATTTSLLGSRRSSAAARSTSRPLTVSAVPEPSTYGLIGAGALATVALVRRRRKASGLAK